MVDLHIGRHGVVLLLVVFLLLGLEDILIWMRSGAVPGVEFLVAIAIVLVVFALAIRNANLNPPPQR